MSRKEAEKKYGKVLSIRLRPENAWIVEAIEDELKATAGGKKLFTGRSEVVELILAHHFKKRKEDELKRKGD